MARSLCYGARLSLSSEPKASDSTDASFLPNIFGTICHELYSFRHLLLLPIFCLNLGAQIFSPPLPSPPETVLPSPNVNQKLKIARENGPPPDQYYLDAIEQTTDGPWRRLRLNARIETSEMLLLADEIDWNYDTGDVELRGNVHYTNYVRGEKLDCDRAELNIEDDTGRFYNVKGSAMSQVQARPGLLTTQNPFYFESKWAERLKDHYILHDGFLTDCLMPRPWWILKGPEFDVVPGDHAIARRSWFYLRRIPLFYTPWFYKSLQKQPRRSGFLIPDIGNNSLHGKMVGFGYYWAISRSFDLTYRGQYYSLSGLANHAELRGKLNENTGFDLTVFGIKDTQQTVPDSSGVRVNLVGKSYLGDGWEARGVLDYLSSFNFVTQFTQSFNEAIFAETHSVGYVTKHWGDFGVDFLAQRDVNFQSTAPGDTVVIRKLPSVEFTEREHQLDVNGWPFWLSFDSSAGLLDRTQPQFQTRQFVPRLDLAPHVTTAFRWHDFQIVPTFGIRETEYGSSIQENIIDGQVTPVVSSANLLRSSRDVTLDIVFPALERIYNSPYKWMGEKVKHVIEPRITYKYVTGIDNFSDVLRFDENDILANTNQLEFSLTNRLLTKDKNGTVYDFLTWQVRYDRYFDPTFGGAVIAGQRNVIAPEIDMDGFAFLDGPRNYSPVSSVIRLQSRINFEWRADYDPLYHRFSNSSVSIDGRIQKYFWSVGNTNVRENIVLEPRADQIHARLGYGNPNSRGWNSGFDLYYDIRAGTMEFWDAQVTYNTDCCGFSFQYRRFSIGTRDDSQYEGSFAISNIGTFGTLKRQLSIF